MEKPVHIEFYRSYRFAAVVESGGEGIQDEFPILRIDQDPFTQDIFLYKGIEKERPLMADRLPKEGILHVILYDREQQASKRISIRYKSFRAIPLQLDASKEGFAIERVVLTGIEYSGAVDISRDDVPPVLLTEAD